MNKKELLENLNKIPPQEWEKYNISFKDIQYIKERIVNDKLGLNLRFNEVDELLDKAYPILKEVSELNINSEESFNHLIIEGENYHALKCLRTANLKVDVIYIDPPYNTGKEFTYTDDRGTVQVVGQDDEHKHSSWLSFIKRRLEIAKSLLNDDGLIFVSIDDNEQAYLKVLMDEIFGENNFVCNFIWEKTYSPKNNNKFVSVNHDYIICFAKNKVNLSCLNRLSRTEENNKQYVYDDNDGRGLYRLSDLTVKGKKGYSIIHNNIEYEEPSPSGWRYNKNKMEELIKNNRIWFPNKSNGRPQLKRYLSEVSGIISKTILEHSLVGHTDDNQRSFNSIMGLKEGDTQWFDYPKGSKLLKYLINLHPNKNAVILDFFAGSGTTAQAVMELNQEDDGNRRFILVTNNENNICRSVCWERIYRVINGIGSKGEAINWKYSDKVSCLSNNHVKFLMVDYINNHGEFEDLYKHKKLYQKEFNKDLTISDFNK